MSVVSSDFEELKRYNLAELHDVAGEAEAEVETGQDRRSADANQ